MISSTLKRQIEHYACKLETQSELLSRARNGSLRAETVAQYLTSIRYLIRHTPVHLNAARLRAEALGLSPLAQYFVRKAAEELDHDRWADADLDTIRRLFELGELPPVASSMRALVTYLSRIVEENPQCYLAYILFAEHFTVLMGPVWLHALETHCGVPASAMTVVGHHVELDIAHVQQGTSEIDALISHRDEAHRLENTLEATLRLYDSFFSELTDADKQCTSRQNPSSVD